MSKRDKLRRKLRNNPKGVKFSQLETLLLRFGFQLVRIKGSHHFYQYQHGDTHAIMVVPVHAGEVKVQYVKDAVALLDELFPEVESSSDEEQENDGE